MNRKERRAAKARARSEGTGSDDSERRVVLTSILRVMKRNGELPAWMQGDYQISPGDPDWDALERLDDGGQPAHRRVRDDMVARGLLEVETDPNGARRYWLTELGWSEAAKID